ncbi:hypothetical protein RAA17_09935 [Komagataeibacter rhaeticus]|nr:hypothetical protein [Komagataeibacter rhaeticus]
MSTRISEIVGEVLGRQCKLLDEALQTLRLHYHGYSEALENRMLRQIALRLEEEKYDTLMADSLLSEELHRELHKDVEHRREQLDFRLKFNIRAGIESRIHNFPCSKGLPMACCMTWR